MEHSMNQSEGQSVQQSGEHFMEQFMEQSMQLVLPILGKVRLSATDHGLTSLELVFEDNAPDQGIGNGLGAPGPSDPESIEVARARAQLCEGARQLEAYFQRKLEVFDLPLDLRKTAGGNTRGETGPTAFQLDVWAAIARIPYGTTQTYGEVACAIKSPGAARAVGQAAGKNPLPILVPCHRLVSKGGFGGYSLGPRDPRDPRYCMALKRHLLLLEAGMSTEHEPSP